MSKRWTAPTTPSPEGQWHHEPMAGLLLELFDEIPKITVGQMQILGFFDRDRGDKPAPEHVRALEHLNAALRRREWLKTRYMFISTHVEKLMGAGHYMSPLAQFAVHDAALALTVYGLPWVNLEKWKTVYSRWDQMGLNPSMDKVLAAGIKPPPRRKSVLPSTATGLLY